MTALRAFTFPRSTASLDPMLDTIFNDFFNTVSKSSFANVAQKSNYPRVDIKENRESVTIDATVPGLSKEDINIDYDNGYLTVSAEKQLGTETGDFVHREIHRSAFSRSFSVDESIYEVIKIYADLLTGILSITIPKKEEAVQPLPKKISIN